MAQTSSAAREPSMEEILASIRRIIEDSDVVRQSVPPKPERPLSERPNVAERPHVAPVRVAPVRGEIAEFRREPEPVLRSPHPVQTATPVQATQTVQASPLEREAERSGRRNEQADEAMNALAARIGLRGALDVKGEAATQAAFKPAFIAIDEDDEPELDAVNDDLPAKAEALKQAHAMAKPEMGTVKPDVTFAAVGRAEPVEKPGRVVDQGPQFLTTQPAPEKTEPVFEEPAAPYVATDTPPIISQVTGLQVAAAFEGLSSVMRAEQRRSFDEMAEKMLRPMLQDWLDNNLPSLVERLVREEIERVVRAGRG
ncbi:PopZ family protein [Phyllobacterium leguminum]|uniref:Cell pole-organizing protein PopZ n=1 Tax=Phyllobacterium leguminum TaxID=314237 RepID=A0A318SZC8_9HYPH|nr:DUF2497 domain-containing protein [Phyllobacterium leguminum]PYE86864.1 hypothetical protein C7477_1182 [Phyllobacterium leguminum]